MKFVVEPIRNIEDIERLKKWFKSYDIRYYTIFMIGLYSGLRISDILGLNDSDVKDKTYIEVIEQKTGKQKRFPLNNEVQQVIKDYLVWKEKKDVWSFNKDALFVGKQHGRIDKSQIWRIIKRAVDDLGIDGNFGTHTMRKTFGYHHYKQNHDVALLQKIFNHSSPFITLRYIGIEQEEINESYRQFTYDYDMERKIKQEERKRKYANYADIENAMEYLLNCYKRLEKKIDHLKSAINPPKSATVKFLENYLESGDTRFKGFAEKALSYSVALCERR